MSAQVTRREDGLALRALRVGVHPDALVMHVGTDVVVRTPARPDHHDGNVIDLLSAPEAASVPERLEAARRLMAPIGVRRLHLRYECPSDGEVANRTASAERERAAAFETAGCRLTVRRVLVLGARELPAAAPDLAPDLALERLVHPEGDVLAERRWYAASVLDRYAHGEDVTAWRAWDETSGGWHRDRVRALAGRGRAEVHLAVRHGMPVATLTLLTDLEGLVVIDEVVTHPAHRRRGLARILLTSALASLRDIDGVQHVVLAAGPDTPRERLALGLGFHPLAESHCWLQDAPAPGPSITPSSSAGGLAEAQG